MASARRIIKLVEGTGNRAWPPGTYQVRRTGGEHYAIMCGRQQVCVMACSSGDRMSWLAMCTDARRAGHPELAALLKANRP